MIAGDLIFVTGVEGGVRAVPPALRLAAALRRCAVRDQGRRNSDRAKSQDRAILKQGRLKGAVGDYYASPAGAAGKVFLLSQQGKATVIRAGADWDILASNDLDDETYATPAIVDDKL